MSFSHARGIVIENSFSTEQNVYSSGGGGAVVNGYGAVYAPAIHTQNIEKQDFWLKTETGEKNFWLRGHNVPMRKGHEITIIFYDRTMISIVNHTIGEAFYLAEPWQFTPNVQFLPEMGKPLALVLFWASLFLFWPSIVYHLWQYYRRIKNRDKIISQLGPLFTTETRRILNSKSGDGGQKQEKEIPVILPPVTPRAAILPSQN